MALSREVEMELKDISEKTRQFEISLRTSFNAKNPNNYVTIQRVNIQCSILKGKVQAVLNNILPNDYCRAQSTIDTANFYIRKYEGVTERGLLLDGDILVLAAQGKMPDTKKMD